tara:strand:+ start:2782 stop:3798 length:1017 start_codon:yes stop_codon:yes gene_type:complete
MSFTYKDNTIHKKTIKGIKNVVGKIYGKAVNLIKIGSTASPSKPNKICIELTNRCNLNCPFCLVGQQDQKESVAHDSIEREMSGMDMELCKKIITSARDFGLKEVNLTFQGEPLMFKRTNFIKLVKFIKQNGLKAIVYTNGLLLDRDYSRKIIKAGLDECRFSVDGITQDVYALNRVGGKYSQVYQNMKDTVQVAQEERSAINIIWQFIAMRNNEHQIDEARSIANKIGIKFEVKTFAASVPELVPKDSKYQRTLKPPPCHDIYRQVMVYWNGDVVPCCYDIEGLEIMGNLNDSSLSEIWNGSKFQIFRERLNNVLQNPEGEPELCKGCLKYDSPSKA